MTPDDPRHGTGAGYQAHRRAGQDACEPCKRATANDQSRRWLDRQQGNPRRHPTFMVHRRVQALMALGWPAHRIAKAAGYGSTYAVQKLMYSGAAYVTRDTFLRIDHAYQTLSGKRGPSEITRGRARAAGHVPPLAWDSIDDPDEIPQGYDLELTGCGTRHGYNAHLRAGEPTCPACRAANAEYQRARKGRPTPVRKIVRSDVLDEVAIGRRMAGDKTVPLSKAEQAQVVDRWLASGGSGNDCERVTGINVHRFRSSSNPAA